MNRYIRHIIGAIALLFLQFLFLNNFILYDTAFCFVYVATILFMPYDTPPMVLIFAGFLLGISVDIMGNTLGMNASATVLIAYLRPMILRFMTPKSGYDQNFSFSIRDTGFIWLVSYAGLLITVHHLLLFLLDASTFSLIGSVLLKTLFSSLLTLTVILLGKLLFTPLRAKNK